MNPADVSVFLAQSLADRRLSGSEKAALADWLARNVATDQHRGVVRHAAFDAARAAAGVDAAAVVDWLEDVLKVVAPVQPGAGARPPAEADALFAPGDACLRRIVQRLQSAQKSADLCVFTITDDRVSGAVLAAHDRGVAVRIISDREKAADQGSDIQRFLQAGIPVKVDDVAGGGSQGLSGHMHHKFALFDGGRLLTGSYNWTRGAAETNYENVIDTTDPKLVRLFAAEFERLWTRF